MAGVFLKFVVKLREAINRAGSPTVEAEREDPLVAGRVATEQHGLLTLVEWRAVGEKRRAEAKLITLAQAPVACNALAV